MQRSRLILTSATALCGALAFLLGTVGTSSPADADDLHPVSRPTTTRPATVRRVQPQRSPTREPGLVVRDLSLSVTLSTDLSDAMPAATAMISTWDAERVWPLPDDLPSDPVLLALQDVLAADEEERDAALDALDATLVEAEPASDPWVELAWIEAERTLARAAYDDALLHHEAALVQWAESGGHGALPEPPAPWSALELGDDAHALARAVDVFQDDPAVADLARLTAAASWLDWTADDIDEDQAVEVLVDVIEHTDDPLVLAGAMDLLVGTDTVLPEGTLPLLAEQLPRLPEDVAMRVAWFSADRHLRADDVASALVSLDAGIAAGAQSDAPATHDALSQLQRARSAVFGHSFGTGGATLTDAFDALAWHCWSQMVSDEADWVAEGTDYSGVLAMLPGGPVWSDWTDDNPHRACLVDGADSLPMPIVPTRLTFQIRLADPGRLFERGLAVH